MEINTGISFKGVTLTELDFKLNKNFKLPKGGIPVDIEFKQKNFFSSDKKTLNVLLTAILFQKKTNQPFVMKVSIEGTFTGKDYTELEKFSKVHAPAHLFPFIREIIGNTTLKANIPPLLLPPFNLASILTSRES